VGFPLKYSPTGPFVSNGHLFLTDWPRWKGHSERTRWNCLFQRDLCL